ncbi:MAG: 3'-5' exonuclease [Pseudomonadota bacterium]
MAEMIPERLPQSSTAGERRIFTILQRLPDDCLVYYEPAIRNRHPDFVVIAPALGVLVVEVKGWYPAQVVRADANDVVVQIRDRNQTHKHPLRQVRDYMFRLMDEARHHRFTAELLQSGVSRQGRFQFPFGYLVVLNNMRRQQLQLSWEAVFPSSKILTRDELDVLEDMPPSDVLSSLQRYFDPWWEFPPLDDRRVSVLRALIHPEIVLQKPGEPGESLTLLDLRQERNAQSIGDGHRLIYGVAGSGKTVILVARAKLLAEDPEKSVLILCYNRGLAQYLRSVLSGFRNITALTFHAWGARQGVQFRPDEGEDDFGQRLHDRLQHLEGEAGRFDSVLVDEAQDFPRSWFQCAKYALKDPDNGDLLIVGDWGQSLYHRRRFTWREAGIHAQGRTIHARFDLDRNYRNTREILRIAAPFSLTSDATQEEDGSTKIVPIAPDAAIRSGVAPKLLSAETRVGECGAVAHTISDWLRDGLPTLSDKPRRIPASDIAVLYPRLPRDLSEIMNGFVAELEKRTPVHWPNRPHSASARGNGLNLRTIHSSKGLQWPAVIVLWADLLPMSSVPQQVQSDRSLLYVAMTRAEDVLLLTRSRGSSFTREIERLLEQGNV